MKTQACSTVVGGTKQSVIILLLFSNHQLYSCWNISLFYYSTSGHQICVWAQKYTILPRRHDCDHTIITSQGTNVSGHKRVWAQSCGLKYVWAQTCGLRQHIAVAHMHSLRDRSLLGVWQHVCHIPNVCAESVCQMNAMQSFFAQ